MEMEENATLRSEKEEINHMELEVIQEVSEYTGSIATSAFVSRRESGGGPLT